MNEQKKRYKNIIIGISITINVFLIILLIIVSIMFIKNKEPAQNNSKSNVSMSSNTNTTDENYYALDKTKNNNNVKTNTKSDYINIELNKHYTIPDVAEIEFYEITVAEKILPPNTSSVYSYHEDIENENYIVLKGSYKNLSTTTFNYFNDFDGRLKLNDKYEYDNVYINFFTPNSSDFYDNPKPLQTMDCYIYISVPNEILNDSSNIYSFYLNFKPDSQTINAKFKIDFTNK